MSGTSADSAAYEVKPAAFRRSEKEIAPVRPGHNSATAPGAGTSAMTDLLQGIAGLPQIQGRLAVKLLAEEPSSGFCLLRTDIHPKVAVAVVQGSEAESYARMLSGAPAMLDLLAVLLVRWGDAVADDDEINGGDAVAWLSQFTAEVREALQAIVGPLPQGPAS